MTPDQVVETVKQLRQQYITSDVWNLVNELSEKIKNGELVFKTPLTHDEYDEIINQLKQGNLDAALEKGSVMSS